MKKLLVNLVCLFIRDKNNKREFRKKYLLPSKYRMFLNKMESMEIDIKKIAQLQIQNEINTYLLNEITDKRIQKETFKKFVNYVEIGTSSFCNRQCFFCPNKFIDRHSQNIKMSDKVYEKILGNLQEIEYNGSIGFQRYNEPLADVDYILKRVKQAREYLPNAYLYFHTNGDYLTKEILEKLPINGLNQIRIQCYLNEDENFDVKNVIIPKMKKLMERVGLSNNKNRTIKSTPYYYSIIYILNNFTIVFEAYNFKQVANNRGGTLGISDCVTFKPCSLPIYQFYIDYNGTCTPCCNLRFDVSSHKNFILGDVNDSDIFDIYCGAKMCEVRKEVCFYGKKNSACNSCSFTTTDITIHREAGSKI